MIDKCFYAMYSTHDNFDTGHGRKIHIGDENFVWLYIFGVNKIDEALINQHDPDKNMCQKM